ncbi:MAG: hypothetical protein QM767_26020 [Anaeromyxobacter sp.]
MSRPQRSVRDFTALGRRSFPNREIDAFITAFFEYLLLVAETLGDDVVSPFYRAVESDMLLYGRDGEGRFFEDAYDTVEAFGVARADLESRFGSMHGGDWVVRERIMANYVAEPRKAVSP